MRTFFGVVCALLALLCGGCSVVFLGSGLSSNLGDMTLLLALGGIPALIFGFFSWLLLRKKPAAAAPSSAPQKMAPSPEKPDETPR